MLKKMNLTKRQKWEAGLTWFRLRYLEPPTRCLNLLSRSAACGRIALYYLPGEVVSELYLGLPETHTRLLRRMAADFGFSLKPKPQEVEIPAAQRMTAVTALPWDSAFIAHIANEFAFVSLVGGDRSHDHGQYLPQPPSTGPGRGPATWQMPDNPPPGLTLKPSWDSQPPSAYLVATEPDPRRWPLGQSSTGVPLHISGRVNIYGRGEAVADWLVHQVTRLVTVNPANLVVIDGAGDLVPRLKRKAAVTRLLGKQLIYVDMDGDSLTGGFNPLAAAPGETTAETVERWQWWFEGMGVSPQGIHLLALARQDGAGDIPALQKWLKLAGWKGRQTAVSSLSMTLNRLTADRNLREWLEWPANRFENLPEGALFFSCKNTGWDRRQLLRMALRGAMQVEGVRLVIHGFPWDMVDLTYQKQIIVSNGPLLPGGTVVLAECHAQGAAVLAGRFLNGDVALQEKLELLQSGEGLVVIEEGVVLAGFSRGGPTLQLKKNGQMRDSTTILDKWKV